MTLTRPAPILVLHDAGNPDAGAPWRGALVDAGWPGDVHAPDLPGHAGTPPPTGGHYEISDAVFSLLPLLGELAAGPAPVVVGVGANGWSAQLLAVGGRASALVLVDGIGGPWLDPDAGIAAGRDLLRAIAEDPAALAPPPPHGMDPRLLHGVPRAAHRAMAERIFAALSVPLLALESPASPLTADDRAELLARSPAPASTVAIPDALPRTVVPRILAWADARRHDAVGTRPSS